jgi:hypothetical protein
MPKEHGGKIFRPALARKLYRLAGSHRHENKATPDGDIEAGAASSVMRSKGTMSVRLFGRRISTGAIPGLKRAGFSGRGLRQEQSCERQDNIFLPFVEFSLEVCRP